MQKQLNIFVAALAIIVFAGCDSIKNETLDRPNILWIVAEDLSSHFGYQDEKLVKTPNVDRLAAEGVVFRNTYVSAMTAICRFT